MTEIHLPRLYRCSKSIACRLSRTKDQWMVAPNKGSKLHHIVLIIEFNRFNLMYSVIDLDANIAKGRLVFVHEQ
jgi:hypothetical protein